MPENNVRKKFHFVERNGIVYIKTDKEDFNIDTYRKAKIYFDAANGDTPKLLRLLKETDGSPELLTVGNEPNDNLVALKNIKWEQQIEL